MREDGQDGNKRQAGPSCWNEPLLISVTLTLAENGMAGAGHDLPSAIGVGLAVRTTDQRKRPEV
jgi:hypothetical protein